MSDSAIAPAWAVLPLAALTMLVVAAYTLALASPAAARLMPPSRRRIRTASAWLTLVTVPLIASGFALVPPAQGRAFVLVWSAGTGLIALILLLAMLDLGDTWRLRRLEQRRITREVAVARRAAALAALPHQRPSAHPERPDAR